MLHVEAVILMFDPDYDVRAIAVKRRNANRGPYKRGTTFRAALDVLRTAEGPLTSREVSRRLLAQKGITEPTQKQVRDMLGSVHRSLRNHEGKSAVTVGEGMPARWAIAG